jgi:hypothetical protein
MKTFIAGEVLYAADLNENFTEQKNALEANIAQQFAQNGITTQNLTFGYLAGRVRTSTGTVLTVPSGTVALTASQTNYVQLDPETGVVSANIVGFSATHFPLRVITTDAISILTSLDARSYAVAVTAASIRDASAAGRTLLTAANAAAQRSALALDQVNNTSDLAKPISTATQSALDLKLNASQRGAVNGVAEIDATGFLPLERIPVSLLGAVRYQSTWDAATNTPAIPAASASNKGHYYRVATAGTTSISSIADWGVADWIISNGASWEKIDNSEIANDDTTTTAQDPTASNAIVTLRSVLSNLWTAISGKQPLNANLTSIAALSTTSFGRGLLILANAAGLKSAAGLANVDNTSDVNKPISTAVSTALSGKQPSSSILDSIAALATNSYGIGLLQMASAGAAKTYLEYENPAERRRRLDTLDLFYDFISTTPLSAVANSATVAAGLAQAQNRPSAQLMSGTNANGACGYYVGSTNFGSSAGLINRSVFNFIEYFGAFQIPVFSDGIDTFTFYLGGVMQSTNVATTPTAGAFFRVTGSTLEAVCSNSGETAVAYSTPLVAGSWYRVRLRITGGSKVEFWLMAANGTETLIATTTSNVVTTGAQLRPTMLLIKSAGTTSRLVYVSGFGVYGEYSSTAWS